MLAVLFEVTRLKNAGRIAVKIVFVCSSKSVSCNSWMCFIPACAKRQKQSGWAHNSCFFIMLLCMYSRKCSLLWYYFAFTHRKAWPMMIPGNNPHICVRDLLTFNNMKTAYNSYKYPNGPLWIMNVHRSMSPPYEYSRLGKVNYFRCLLFFFEDCFCCLAGGSCFAFFASSPACVCGLLVFGVCGFFTLCGVCGLFVFCYLCDVLFCILSWLCQHRISLLIFCVAFWRRHS